MYGLRGFDLVEQLDLSDGDAQLFAARAVGVGFEDLPRSRLNPMTSAKTNLYNLHDKAFLRIKMVREKRAGHDRKLIIGDRPITRGTSRCRRH